MKEFKQCLKLSFVLIILSIFIIGTTNPSQVLADTVQPVHVGSSLVKVDVNPNDQNSAGLYIGLQAIKDIAGNLIVNPSIAEYKVEIEFDPSMVTLLDAVDVAQMGHFTTQRLSVNSTTDKVIIEDQAVALGISNFDALFFVPIALKGSALDVTSVSIKYVQITEEDLSQVIIEAPELLEFQRGKILNEVSSGSVVEPGLDDAIAGLRYLAKQEAAGSTIGEINPINMASIYGLSSGATVNKPDVKDIVALLQYIVDLRNDYFQSTTVLASVPTELVATTMSSSEIDLSWAASSGATSYNLYRSTSLTGTYEQVNTNPITTRNYSDNGLVSSTSYYYYVTAVNSTGESAQSEIAEATTATALVIPDIPTELIATTISASQIDLSWTASSGATSYNVYSSTSTLGTYTKVNTDPITATTYSNTGLLSSTSYYYYVTAVNSAGESGQSTEATATTSTVIPDIPTELIATTISASQIDLSWTASSGATSYNVYSSTSTPGTYTKVNTNPITATTYSNNGLVSSTSYYYYVTAVNSAGESGQSTEATATTSTVIPDIPTELIATTISASQIDLSWTASSGATSYNVYSSTSTPGTYTKVNTNPITATTYSNNGLVSSTSYYYYVTAVNSAGESGQSTVATATTAAVVPIKPTGLVGTALSSTQINLSWTPLSNATSYNIYRGNSLTGEYSKINSSSVTSPNYSDIYEFEIDGTKYYYKVTAVNSAGESPRSDALTVTTPPDTMDTAKLIAEGTTVTGKIDSLADLDYFRFTPTTSDRYEIKSLGTTDVWGYLYNSSRIQLIENDDYDDVQFQIIYNLIAGETYYLKVSGSGTQYNTGPYSIQVNVMPPYVVEIPTGLTATYVTSSRIDLAWNPVSGATSYNIYWSGDGVTYDKIAYISAMGQPKYSDPFFIASGETFYYKVTALDGNSETGFSQVATVSRP